MARQQRRQRKRSATTTTKQAAAPAPNAAPEPQTASTAAAASATEQGVRSRIVAAGTVAGSIAIAGGVTYWYIQQSRAPVAGLTKILTSKAAATFLTSKAAAATTTKAAPTCDPNVKGPCYVYDESKGPNGPGSCEICNDMQCSGTRYCTQFGWCYNQPAPGEMKAGECSNSGCAIL